VRAGGRLVSLATEPAPPGIYFVVESNREQLEEITRLVDDGELRPEIDSVYLLEEAQAAFERSLAAGKRGKVVLRVSDS
jgi:NADPH:quinone reductase-like Zn-dependent oxidoreductase